MEDAFKGRVAIIGGKREETPDELKDRVSRDLYRLCLATNKKEFDLKQFRDEIKHRLNNEQADIYEILAYYDKLGPDEKLELINKFGTDYIDDELKNSDKTEFLHNIRFDDPKLLIPEDSTGERYLRKERFNEFITRKMNRGKRYGYKQR